MKRSLTQKQCVDCGASIPAARIQANPATERCVRCQQAFEQLDPSLTERKIDEGLAGTREDHKRMRGNLRSDMGKRNYE